MNVATFLIILWVPVLIGICFIVKRLNTIEEKMTKFHNHLVDSIDTYYKDTVNNLSDVRKLSDVISESQQYLENGIGKWL